MSGFDFGALCDPDAPEPGSHHRDAVEARAREISSKTRRNRTLLSGVAVVVVIAAVAGIVTTRPDHHQLIVTDPSSTTAAATTVPTTQPTTPRSSIDGRFIPPTTTENGRVVLPVTFPDGEHITLRYPHEMRVAQLGLAGAVGANWPVVNGSPNCCSRYVGITYQTIADVYGDATPVHVYRGPNGEPVPYFHSSQALKPVRPQADSLVFQFGRWLVQVYDLPKTGQFELRMTDAQRETWARGLTGTVDDHGYLLLHAAAPLSIANTFSGSFGATPGNALELAAHIACGRPESATSVRSRFNDPSGTGVAWCAGDLHLSATGKKPFIDLAASELQVTGAITQASPTTETTTTTTTTTPAVPPANAVSASFVSTNQGWILEKDGTVAETTDKGTSWSTVGSLGSSDLTIRFADPTHGFAFSNQLTNQPVALVTTDGGATWTAMNTPFSGQIYALTIASGTVYAVTFDSNNPKFRIWSSPADNLSWTEDPITIPVGAGPDPSVQLVFNGGAGWLVVVNRTVIGGAQMSTTGHWSPWTPPCATVNGPTNLAAWNATDLIASCDEGVWGSPPNPGKAVYTSHDAGATFQRHDAPVYGSVAAADPNDALLVTDNTIYRSIDCGKTWTVVEGLTVDSLAAGRPLDLGFTSNTQGFVIFPNGQMVMTYDSGATWNAVTQP